MRPRMQSVWRRALGSSLSRTYRPGRRRAEVGSESPRLFGPSERSARSTSSASPGRAGWVPNIQVSISSTGGEWSSVRVGARICAASGGSSTPVCLENSGRPTSRRPGARSRTGPGRAYDAVWLAGGGEAFHAVGDLVGRPAVVSLDDLHDHKANARLAIRDGDAAGPSSRRFVARSRRRASTGGAGATTNGGSAPRSTRWRCAVSSTATVSRSANVRVVPNIYPAPPRAVGSIVVKSPPTISIIGQMHYAPNADGATFFVREVLPELRRLVPDVQVRLVGEPDPAVRAARRCREGHRHRSRTRHHGRASSGGRGSGPDPVRWWHADQDPRGLRSSHSCRLDHDGGGRSRSARRRATPDCRRRGRLRREVCRVADRRDAPRLRWPMRRTGTGPSGSRPTRSSVPSPRSSLPSGATPQSPS